MSGLTPQSVALVQRVFGAKLVGDDDGIAGQRTNAAIISFQMDTAGPTTGKLSDRQFFQLTGVELDGYGDPDYASWFHRCGFNATGFAVKGHKGKFLPKGVLVHHTAAFDGDDDPSNDRTRIPPERMTEGRSDLPGPIVQVGVSRDKSIDCYTNGRAYHAGQGDPAVLKAIVRGLKRPTRIAPDGEQGNNWWLGIEVDHSGRAKDPLGDHWEQAARVAAAWCILWGWHPNQHVIGHWEWTARKTDPIYDIDIFRGMVLTCRWDILSHLGEGWRYGEGDAPAPKPLPAPVAPIYAGVDFAMVAGKRYKLIPDD